MAVEEAASAFPTLPLGFAWRSLCCRRGGDRLWPDLPSGAGLAGDGVGCGASGAWNFLDRRAEEKQGTYHRGRWGYLPGIAVFTGSVFPTPNELGTFTEINSRKRKSKEEEKRVL